MDRLRGMEYFVRAVELGSLSAAARELGSTQPTVSKILTGLEKELGVRLLERSSAGLALTGEGRRFYERARQLVDGFTHAVADARGQLERASGLLRINAPVAFGQFRLNALVRDFLEPYPDLEVELILNDRFVDLVEEGVDIALRLGDHLPPDAVARRIAVSPRLLVASPAYLHGRPALQQPSDLAGHNYVRFAWLATGDEVALERQGERVSVTTRGRYRVNNALAIRDTLAAGGGVGLCPAWLVQDLIDQGQLTHVLPEWSGESQQMSLLYPSRRYQPLRAKLFIEFLAKHVPAIKGFEA